MTEIINLNQQRKAKARTQKEAQAAENCQKFGRTKAQKQKEKQLADKLERHLEDHKRDTEEEKE